MAVQTGTSTGLKDLLGKLKTFLLANGWTSLSHTVGATVEDPDTIFLKGTGTSIGTPVHINIRTYGNNTTQTYGFDVFGAVSYTSGVAIDLQLGTSATQYAVFPTTNGTMTYWFYVSNTRFIVVIKSSTSYSALYAGFYKPLCTPVEYPFPLCIGSQGTSTIKKFSDTLIDERRGFFCPGESQVYLRDVAGIWQSIRNFDSGYSNRSIFGSTDGGAIIPSMNAYYGQYGGTNYIYSFNLQNAAFGASVSSFPVIPLVMFNVLENGSFYGMLEGVYHAFEPQAAESTLTIGANTYRVFQGAATGQPIANKYMILEA
jgi:hypothetical protein